MTSVIPPGFSKCSACGAFHDAASCPQCYPSSAANPPTGRVISALDATAEAPASEAEELR